MATLEYRDMSGRLVCTKYYSEKKGAVCLDFVSDDMLDHYANDPSMWNTGIIDGNGIGMRFRTLVMMATGTDIFPNPRVTVGALLNSLQRKTVNND